MRCCLLYTSKEAADCQERILDLCAAPGGKSTQIAARMHEMYTSCLLYTSECVEKIADYEEDSIPVLTQDGKIAGILTATDIVELVDDAMGDDYAKLAGDVYKRQYLPLL